MAKDNEDGHAFPQMAIVGQAIETTGGMTLLDYFAGQAMTGWLASYQPGDGTPVPSKSAEFFYSLADAMIEHRDGQHTVNARPVAAAPDLVEALELIAKLTPHAANAADAMSLHLTVKAIAETAIAKARGEV